MAAIVSSASPGSTGLSTSAAAGGTASYGRDVGICHEATDRPAGRPRDRSCSTMHVRAGTGITPQRRAPPGDPRHARSRRQGRRRAAGGGAGRVRGHDPARPARAGRPRPGAAGARRRAAAGAAARHVRRPGGDVHAGEGGAGPRRGRRARRRARRADRRLDDQPRARAPPARRAAPDRAHQLAADRRAARLAPDRPRDPDRRDARQAGVGHGRRPRRRLHPLDPRRRLRARRLRAAPGGRAEHGRPRGGLREARDGRRVGRRDRARHDRQAARRQPVRGRARQRGHAPRRRGGRARRPARPVPRGRHRGDQGMSARWVTTAIFAVNGAAIGTWVANIPWVQERFDLSKSTMGMLILAMSISVIVALPFAGQAVARHGSERITLIGGLGCVLAVNLPILAPAPVLVAAGLFVLGGSSATMDVAMNSHGVAVEKVLGRPIMSSLHAGWAFGGMAGAGFSAAWAGIGLDARLTTAIASALLLVALLSVARRLGHGSAAEGDDAPAFALPSRGVVLLAILCFLVMITEGAMADWSGLYLRQDLGASAALAALAYSFFTAGMTAGRLVGDAINARIGPVALLRGGALLTGLPLAALLLIGQPAAALIGLFLVGLGVANGVPLMFSAAGRQPDTPPGPGIAAVSSMGSLGFLAGPPFIGFLADAVSLPWALATLIAGAAVVLALARRAVAHGQPEPGGQPEPHPRDPVAVP